MPTADPISEPSPSVPAPLPLVAIVGRVNVGKSSLFNHLIGRRRAIVESSPGVTRDRHYERVSHGEPPFLLVDTGGLGLDPEGIEREVAEQTRLAVEEADVIVFVIDASVGLTATEWEIHAELRKREVPVLVAANKVDRKDAVLGLPELYELGVERIFPVSAEHARGLDELLEAIEALLPQGPPAPETSGEEAAPTAVSVVGRPNVGKSTLINRLLGEKRLVVSPEPGTTRDAIDTLVELGGEPFLFIDTAGIRRKARISQRVEKLSVLGAFRSVERSEVALLLFDATEGLTEQDRRIAGLIEEAGRALILVANKWDLMPKGSSVRKEFEDRVRYLLPGLAWAPLVEISAEKGAGIPRLIRVIRQVRGAFGAKFQTADLNRLLEEIAQHRPPPSPRGRPIRLNYMHQVKTRPPTFILYTNQVRDFPKNYRRFLQNQLRERLGLDCVPVHLGIRSKRK